MFILVHDAQFVHVAMYELACQFTPRTAQVTDSPSEGQPRLRTAQVKDSPSEGQPK